MTISRSQQKLSECPPNQVLRVPNISYLNLILIVKFAYTGEVTMAENRLGGFLEDARTLGLFQAPSDFEVTQKPRKEAKLKPKRSRSKSTSTTANKRAAEDDLQGNDCKKWKQEVPVADCSDNKEQPARPPFNLKRRETPIVPLDPWESQSPKRPRMSMISCPTCYQSFSNLNTLKDHTDFCFEPSDDASEGSDDEENDIDCFD